MINKQNLWFLTLFSLILVLSVYYITMPNDLLIASSSTTEEKSEVKEEKKEEQETVSETDNLTALRVSLDEERDKEKEELKTTMTKEDATTDEKNNAYEELKTLNNNKGLEETITKKLKDDLELESFVKITNDEVEVVVEKDSHDVGLASQIMNLVQQEFTDKVSVSVRFTK